MGLFQISSELNLSEVLVYRNERNLYEKVIIRTTHYNRPYRK